MATCRSSLSPSSSLRSGGDVIGGYCGLASLYRLFRRLDIRYYDNFEYGNALKIDAIGTFASPVSVRKYAAKRAQESDNTAKTPNLAEIYLEICILKHPSLKGHPHISELIGVTLLNSPGDSLDYNIGLITRTIHGTLEDLFAVERKVCRDPRSYLISWTEREEIILQCAEGLAALHDCNILHNNVQPSSFTVYIAHPTANARTIQVKLSDFSHAVPVTLKPSSEDVPPANGKWSSIGPLATCVSSPFCRDIHSFGLMVMYMSYYEFMGVEECMEFLKTQRGFYDELGMHPALDTALSLFNIVSRCCISHEVEPISMHWVASNVKKGYESITIPRNDEYLRAMLVNSDPFGSIADYHEEFLHLRKQASKQRWFNHHLFRETIQNVWEQKTALYLSFCHAYGIGTVCDYYTALQWCITAADDNCLLSKSIIKMVYDAYLSSANVQSDAELTNLYQIGQRADSYLIEVLQYLQDTSIDQMDEDMTRICWYLCNSDPATYANSIFPLLRWPVVDGLLQVFNSEFEILGRSGITDYQLYPSTLSYATNLLSNFPLTDSSTLIHCIAHVVSPDLNYLSTLATIVVAAGCDPTALRSDGKSALHLAVQFGNNELVAELLKIYEVLGFEQIDLSHLVSEAVTLHHRDVVYTISKSMALRTETMPVASSILDLACTPSKFMRMINRGKGYVTDGQRLLEDLECCGGPDVLTAQNPCIVEAAKMAVMGGNEDILSYNNWAIPRELPKEALYEIIEITIDLGECSLLQKFLELSNLDHLSILRLLKYAISNPSNTSLRTAEVILDRHPISDEEFVVDLVEAGSVALDLVSKIARRNPHVLSLRFGDKGQPLIQHAIISRNLDMAVMLSDHGASINITNNHGDTPLYTAIKCADDACIEWIINRNGGQNIEYLNNSGHTPLLFAVQIGNLFAVKLLLERGANIEAASYEGFTALHLAYWRYCQRTVQKLRGTMPDLVAQMEERKAREVLGGTLKMLREYGADESAEEYTMGFTPKSYFSWLLETMNTIL